MAGLGLLFPLLGLSMVFIIVLEYAVLRRVPSMARAFGLTEEQRVPATAGAPTAADEEI